jgi:hypothetical protein
MAQHPNDETLPVEGNGNVRQVRLAYYTRMLATRTMGDYDQLQVRSERQTVPGLREGKGAIFMYVVQCVPYILHT